MLTCKNCQHQQVSGKFCEECGTPLENLHNTEGNPGSLPNEQLEQTQVNNQQQGQNNQLDNIKAHTQNYFDFFKNILKNPNLALEKSDQSYLNGIITLVILSITLSLGLYFLLNGLFEQTFGGFGFVDGESESLPFFQITTRLVFGALLIIASGLAGLWITLKIGKVNLSFTTILAQYGALAVPFTILSILSILTGLSTSVQLTFLLVSIALFVFTFLAPVILSFYHLIKTNENSQIIYLSIGSYIITSFIIYILFRIYLENLLDTIGWII
ncbi:zinc ribbon domain-containing protein [Alkalibacillus aidingensis]|uniref:zinc ribbon domain-containing protein n=1 Tax=Alkalibacillus aidingensis TaxID=2747607 RepID=UPI0016605050|nr:zinc ribbon domain-containing protein [Alkalibacillus aidingensis]